MENLLKGIKSVESTHRGLGVPYMFNVLSGLANTSVFNVGSSGSGKTRMILGIVKTMQKLANSRVQNWNAMTYYQLLEQIGIQIGKRLIWTVEEWSMLSAYHQDTLLLISSKVNTDRTFERLMQKGQNVLQIKIDDCDLVVLIAIQPFKFTHLMKHNESWNAIASDRFIKFLIINPLKTKTVDAIPIVELPDCVNANVGMEMPKMPNPILIRLFSEHLRQSRAELATLRYMRAWCIYNNQQEFTDVDATVFHTLFSPYLELYPVLIKGVDPDQEESFHTGAFRILEFFMERYPHSVHVKDITEHFHMIDPNQDEHWSERTIYRHIRVLESRGIINGSNPHYGQYQISKKYQSFFDTYRENWI